MTTNDSSAIQVEALVKTYAGGVEAVKGIDFDVAPGEVFGLLGPNGAGKSTTVGMLTTTIAPTSGRARVAGFDVVTPADRGPAGGRGRLPGARRRPTPHGAPQPRRPCPAVGARPRGSSEAHPRRGCVRPHRADRSAGGHLERRPAPPARDRPGPAVRTTGPVPGRADRRARPAHPPRAARPHRRPAGAVGDDHPADHPLPRRGRTALDRVAIVHEGRIVALDSPAALLARIGREILELRIDGDVAAVLASLRRNGIAGDDGYAVGATLHVPLHDRTGRQTMAMITDLGLPGRGHGPVTHARRRLPPAHRRVPRRLTFAGVDPALSHARHPLLIQGAPMSTVTSTVAFDPPAVAPSRRRTGGLTAVRTLARRRLALSVRTPRELLIPLLAPLLFAVVIAPALAETFGRVTRWHRLHDVRRHLDDRAARAAQLHVGRPRRGRRSPRRCPPGPARRTGLPTRDRGEQSRRRRRTRPPSRLRC